MVHVGNLSGVERFINSVHIPHLINTFPLTVYIHLSYMDPTEYVPCIAYFATRAIKHGEPVLTNYGENFSGDCYCGTEYGWRYCPGRIEEPIDMAPRRGIISSLFFLCCT